MTDEIRGGIEERGGGAVVRRPRLRGHVKLGTRMWARIRREFAAGASVPWLSARYGAGERTIGARAKAEGWRRKDLAEAADDELEAAEADGTLDPVAGSVIGKGLGMDGTAGAQAAAFAAALAGVDGKAREGAAVEALNRAVACMKREDAAAALGWARLAGTLEGLAKGDGAGGGGEMDPNHPGRVAALEFLRRRAAERAAERAERAGGGGAGGEASSGRDASLLHPSTPSGSARPVGSANRSSTPSLRDREETGGLTLSEGASGG